MGRDRLFGEGNTYVHGDDWINGRFTTVVKGPNVKESFYSLGRII